jgi:hypothetical protein
LGRKLTWVVDGKPGSVGEAASAIALVNATSDPGIGRRAAVCGKLPRFHRRFGGRSSFSRRKHLWHSVKIMAEQFNTQPPIAEPLVTATQHTQLYQKSAKVVLLSMRRLQKSGWRNIGKEKGRKLRCGPGEEKGPGETQIHCPHDQILRVSSI